MQNDNLLSGVKVIDLSTFVAAPTCSRLMADLGADVIKVEPPAGDPIRTSASIFEVPATPDENPIWEIYNANKRGVSLNLRESAGMKIMHRLLAEADVFVTNNRTKALEKMGLDYDSLKKQYPRLIFAHVLGYGEYGPLRDQPGFDSVAFWTKSGFLGDIVKEGEYPITSPYAFGDVATGTALFGGVCAALLRQAKTGKGEKVIISLYGSGIWFNGTLITTAQECYGTAFPKKRSAGVPVASPYRCRDGVWLMPTILEYERFFRPFCKVLGVEFLVEDERYKDLPSMMKNTGYAIDVFEKAFAKLDSADILKGMRGADITIEIISHFKDVTAEEQAWANDYLYEFTFGNGNKAVLPCIPIQTPENGKNEYKKAPSIGQHNEEVLIQFGFTQDEIAAFRAARVIT